MRKLCDFYGHLDVLPLTLEVGWEGGPFRMVEQTGTLYGRGSASNDRVSVCLASETRLVLTVSTFYL